MPLRSADLMLSPPRSLQIEFRSLSGGKPARLQYGLVQTQHGRNAEGHASPGLGLSHVVQDVLVQTVNRTLHPCKQGFQRFPGGIVQVVDQGTGVMFQGCLVLPGGLIGDGKLIMDAVPQTIQQAHRGLKQRDRFLVPPRLVEDLAQRTRNIGPHHFRDFYQSFRFRFSAREETVPWILSGAAKSSALL